MVLNLWDRLMGEFIDVIEWTDDGRDTMVWRFERHGNEIKYGAKLTVREGQIAVFVNEGRLADVFPPGMYRLETKNLPILSTILNWDHGFQSPFKSEVYFVSTRRFPDLKWGTKNPIMLRDAEFGPVRLRAYGTYEVRVVDAAKFLREIVGTDGHFTTDEITDQLRNIIVARFSSVLGSAQIPALDLAANYQQLSRFVTDKIKGEIQAYGIELVTFLVENISLPPAVEEALDRRTSIGVVGDLNRYTQYQMGDALTQPGSGAGGAASAGMGLGVGMAAGQQMADRMAGPWGARGAAGGRPDQGPTSPPPLPGGSRFHVALGGAAKGPYSLNELRGLVQDGQMTRTTLVWAQGMDDWAPAHAAPDLAGLFPAAPPPMPPETP